VKRESEPEGSLSGHSLYVTVGDVPNAIPVPDS
jgi:hypothetical protein